MNTYLLPICDSEDSECWIEKIVAKNLTEAEEKFVKKIADKFGYVDYGDTLKEATETLIPYNVVIGDIYDIDEFQ